MRKFLFLLLLIVTGQTLTGCTNVVSGSVDGVTLPKMQSAFYIESEDGYGEDGTVLVWMSSIEDACEKTEIVLAAQDATDEPTDLAAAWSLVYPEDFWEVTVVLRTDDVNDTAAGDRFIGASWDGENEASGSAFANLTHFLRPHDEAFWAGVGEYERYQDLYYTDGGELDIDIHVPGDRIAGYFDADVADWDDGDVQGEVGINFDARRCRGVERVFF